jgi:glycosyltransferase involved in cell wall biosynthesis
VLLVSQEFPPETGWGGIGTYVSILAPALAAAGVEVTVLSVVPGQERRAEHRADGVSVLRAPLPRLRGLGRVTRMPHTARRLALARAVRREVRDLAVRPDVVECPEWGAEGLLLPALGLPVVVRLHSSAAQLFPYSGQGAGALGLDGRCAIALEARAARRAALVISTEANAEEGARLLGLDPRAVRRIAHPVVPRPVPPPAGLGRGAPRVLFAGRLEPRKGPEVLVRALPALRRLVPGARVAFAGRDAGSAPELVSLARSLGVIDGVELLGHCDRATLDAHIAAASVCAVPSRWESFGNVVAECALLGRPVVASDIPPFRELVDEGRTGILVPADDPAAWAAALADLLLNPERAAGMGARGAQHVAALGDPGLIAAQTLLAYADAMALGAQPRRFA